MKIVDKVIRVLTLPSLVTGLMVVLLWWPAGAMSGWECLCSELFLLGVPLLAYPAGMIGTAGEQRRERQRSLAIYFSTGGYVLGAIWAWCSHAGRVTKILFGTYLLSVLLLLLLNKVVGFRASGHACSSTAPAFFLGWQLHPLWALPCLLIVAAVYSSSLRLHRHTLAQLISGSAVSAAAAVFCVLVL